MSYDVVIKTVSAQPLAAVRRRVHIRDIGRTWKPALDIVWEFLRRRKGLRTDGHNCFLYHHPANPPRTSVAMAASQPHIKQFIRGGQRRAGHSQGIRGKSMAIGPMMKQSLKPRSSICCVESDPQITATTLKFTRSLWP